VAIKRKDTGEWAIPGGMVDPGEIVPETVKREFMEEASNVQDDGPGAAAHKAMVDELFANGFEIYRGYVDDPRNTDNAWMESSFVHFHASEKIGASFSLAAGDDAGEVCWLDIDEDNHNFRNLYASHKAMVLRAAARVKEGTDPAAAEPLRVLSKVTVAELPSCEGVPISFDARESGPRAISWVWQKPATLQFLRALDGGDPKNGSKDGKRDAIYLLSRPFTLDGPAREFDPAAHAHVALVLETEYRISSVHWARSGTKLGFVSERWRKNRRTRTWVLGEDQSSGKFSAHVLFDRSFEDAYTSPGHFEITVDENGLYETQGDAKSLEFDMIGAGASPVGNRPFYDKLAISRDDRGQLSFATKRMWRCALAPEADEAKVDPVQEVGGELPPVAKRAAIFESPIGVSPGGKWLLIKRESNDGPPNFFARRLADGREWQLSDIAHPQPSLIGTQSELVQYRRDDGVALSGELYLPAGYEPKRDGPRPCFLWAYPREFKAKQAAGQVQGAEHRFTRASASQPTMWVVKGWAVLRFSSPIVAEGDEEPNDTFVEQVQLNAKAAAEFLIGRGIGRMGGFAVGGHSYGAFMTAHLLAHTNYFNAGIARSGAYLRALTPFGFQAEERSFWESPETYHELSPFSHAPKIAKGRGKLLLLHGTNDENSGTYPMQSERLFDALKGHGAVCRLVLLPNEGHSYYARESVLHMLAEQENWLDKYVSEPFNASGAECEALPALPGDDKDGQLTASAVLEQPVPMRWVAGIAAFAFIGGVFIAHTARL